MDDIEGELKSCLEEIGLLQGAASELAGRMGVDPMHVQNADGTLVMLPLVVAKAQVLTALAPIVQKRQASEWWGNLLNPSSDD